MSTDRGGSPVALPWWGHLIVLALIVGGTVVSVVTGNVLYVAVLVPAAWVIGVKLAGRRAGSREVSVP
jgi:hypothetical protein